jgi:hypothetical protein
VLHRIEAGAGKLGMETRLLHDGGLEILAPGANLYASPGGEIRVLVQDRKGSGERALSRLIEVLTTPPRRGRTRGGLESVRRLALKALLEARRVRRPG